MTRLILAMVLSLAISLTGCSHRSAVGQPPLLPPAEQAAVAAIQKLGGKVVRDANLPGRPVVEVDLTGSMARDGDLKGLREFKNLQYLYLNSTLVTSACLKDVKELRGLKELALGNAEIRDAGLKELKDLKDLHYLDLSGNPISDAAVKDFKELPGLLTLNLMYSKFTDAGLNELAHVLPHTIVLSFHY